ncbi:uncharacterized protein [Diadema setosum]|uniref:uncharacterized protein n=1 Tax=Diadema setosum TaxID=31175 RepID=UPI003B3A93B2
MFHTSVLIILDDSTCHATGSDLSDCVITLQYLSWNIPVMDAYHSCTCNETSPDFQQCTYQRRLVADNPCREETATVVLPPSGSVPSSPGIITEETSLSSSLAMSTAAPLDCLEAIEECEQDGTCARALNAFYEDCTSRKGRCRLTSEEELESCTSSLGQLDISLLQCTCDRNQRLCKRRRKKIQQNPCIVGGTVEQTTTSLAKTEVDTPPSEIEEEDDGGFDVGAIVIGPTGGYNNGESTCVGALTQCTGNDRCRESLGDYLKRCRPDDVTGHCNRESCRHVIRHFFSQVSPLYTHALVYCRCEKDDVKCEAVQDGLNPPCAVSETPTPDCQDLVERCNADATCRSAYANYKELCQPSAATETGCKYPYGACRTARVAILGTVIASSCKCVSNSTDTCRLHQNITFENRCFERATKEYFSSVPPTDMVEVAPTENDDSSPDAVNTTAISFATTICTTPQPEPEPPVEEDDGPPTYHRTPLPHQHVGIDVDVTREENADVASSSTVSTTQHPLEVDDPLPTPPVSPCLRAPSDIRLSNRLILRCIILGFEKNRKHRHFYLNANKTNGHRFTVQSGSQVLEPLSPTCFSLCRCLNGNLENCVSQPCQEPVSCTVNHIEYNHGDLFSHPSRGYCVCVSGNVLCTARYTSASNTQNQLVFPSISIAVDSHMRYQLSSQLDEPTTDGIVIARLQIILDHRFQSPCQLQLLENTDNTLLISVYYVESQMDSCYSQLYTLSNMINTKHPAIAYNPVLTTLKIATVERGVRHLEISIGEVGKGILLAAVSSHARPYFGWACTVEEDPASELRSRPGVGAGGARSFAPVALLASIRSRVMYGWGGR